jgi:hypothetical protein
MSEETIQRELNAKEEALLSQTPETDYMSEIVF